MDCFYAEVRIVISSWTVFMQRLGLLSAVGHVHLNEEVRLTYAVVRIVISSWTVFMQRLGLLSAVGHVHWKVGPP